MTGMPQFAGLTDGNVLFVRVDDPDLDLLTAMSRMPPRLRSSPVLLAGQSQDFLLGAALEPPSLLHRLKLLEALQLLMHSGEVGEHASQPALVR